MPCSLRRMSAGRTRAAAHPGLAARVSASKGQDRQQPQWCEHQLPRPTGLWADRLAGLTTSRTVDLGARPRLTIGWRRAQIGVLVADELLSAGNGVT
jgi:hypothetical protein